MGNWRAAFGIIAFSLVIAVSAAPNRIERSKCPEDRLLVHVNMTVSNRTAHQISKIGARSLVDCTQKCYSNPLCSSLKYREADPLSCLLTSFTPDSCYHITLVPVTEIKHDARALITIECIKCKPTEQLAETGFLISSEPDDATELQPASEPKPCMEGSDCIAPWAPNSTAPSAPAPSSVSAPSTPAPVPEHNTNASTSAAKICDPSSQRCREDILFIAKELDESENLDFLDESISVNSALECAEKCFETCCQVAAYLTTEKKCRFTRKGAAGVSNDDCAAIPLTSFVSQYSGNNPVKITCVACGLASKLGHDGSTPSEGNALTAGHSQQPEEASVSTEVEKPSEPVEGFQSSTNQQPPISSAIDASGTTRDKDTTPQLSRHDPRFMERACIIVFEVDPNADLGYFRGRDHVEASGADHCAYLCYRDACTAAVFTPSTTPGQKGTCERRFDGPEKCNGTLRRDYYYKTTKPVYLQCFRCLPEKPKTRPPLGATTLRPEESLVAGKEELASKAAPPGITGGASETVTLATSAAPATTVPKAPDVESKEVETGVPGTIAPEPASGSMETSGAEEESKENAPRAEPAGTAEASKSSEVSAEERAKSGEQSTAGEVVKPEGGATVKTAGETTTIPVSGEVHVASETEATATPENVSASAEQAAPGTISPSELIDGKTSEATSSSQGAAELGTPATSAKSSTTEAKASSFGTEYGSTFKGSPASTATPSTAVGVGKEKITISVPEASAGIEYGSASEGSTTLSAASTSSVPETAGKETASTLAAGSRESAAEPEAKAASFASPSIATKKPEYAIPTADAEVQHIPEHHSTPAGIEHKAKGASGSAPSTSTAEEIQMTTIPHVTHAVESTVKYGSTPEEEREVGQEAATSASEKEASSTQAKIAGETTLSSHLSTSEAGATETAGVTPPPTTEAGRIGAELYGGSTSMMPSSRPPATDVTPGREVSSDAPKDAGIIGSKVTMQASLDEKTSLENDKSSAESEKSSAEAKSSKEQGTPSESQTVHNTAVATDASTPKAEGQNGEVIKSPATTVVVPPVTVEKLRPAGSEELHDKAAAAVSAKNNAPYEFLQGCIVTFQADPYTERPVESSAGFQASTIARTSEVCAGRCYQDGCTGAKYDPATKECILGYGGKQICNRGPERFFYEANETVWIHCTSCKLHKPGDEGVNILIDPSKAKVAEKAASTPKEAVVTSPVMKGIGSEAPTTESSKTEVTSEMTMAVASETPKGVPLETVTKKDEETSTVASGEIGESKEETTTAIPAVKSSVSDKSEVEKSTEQTVSASPTSATTADHLTGTAEPSKEAVGTVEKKTETPKEELNIDAVPTAVGEVAVTKELGLSIKTTPPGTTLIGHGCVVSFQAGPIATRPSEFTSEFVPKGTAPTAEECAKRCYMEGCTGAKFDPANRECSLTFGDHQQCEGNEEEHHSVEATETLWIHCISCKQEFTEVTLGLLAEDTTVPAVTAESPREEGSSTADGGSTSVPKSTEAEEKFLSTVNQDATLESANHTGPEITLQTGDKSVDEVSETSEENKKETGTEAPSGVASSSQAETVPLKFEPGLRTAAASESASESTTRLPASVSEIKSEESTAAGEAQFDTTPIVVVLESHSTTRPTLQSAESKEESGSAEPSESRETATRGSEEAQSSTDRIIDGGKAAVDVNMVTETAFTEASIVEKVSKTISSDELETTIRPDLLISMTAQTPLSVPIDTSKILGSTTKTSGSSTVEERSTTEPPVKKIEADEQKEGKSLLVTSGFQHESEPTSVPAEIIAESVAHGEVTAHPETGSSEGQPHGEVTNDNVGAVSNTFVVSGTAQTETEVAHLKSTVSVPEGTPDVSQVEATSSNAPEIATVESRAEVTSLNVAGTSGTESHEELISSITAPTASESHTGVTESSGHEAFTEEIHNEVTSSVIPEGTVTVVPVSDATSNAEEGSTIERNLEHADMTSGVTEKTSEEGDSAGGTTSSGAAANAITEQPSVQESIDDNIRKVIQAASESGATVTETVPAATVSEEEVTKKAEGAEFEAVTGSTTTGSGENAVADVSTKGVEGQEAEVEAGASTLLPLDLTTSAAEGSTSANGGVTDAHDKNAPDALVSGEQVTTEPPVQAVSDLVDVLSQNSKIEEVIGRASTVPRDFAEKEKEKESFVVDDMSVVKDKDEQRPPSVAITHLQEASAETGFRSGTKMIPFQGTALGCPGRIEFEVSAVGELPGLNVTNEVGAESPADCARKCYEAADCVLAGFVPRPSGESTSAVCLLTSGVGICSAEEKSISQHTSDTPFIISCLRCSKCNYTVSAVTELTRIRQAEAVEPVLSIGQCAEACSKHGCAVAQYSHKSNLCSLTLVKRQQECSQEKPVAVDGDEPVLLECVRCFT